MSHVEEIVLDINDLDCLKEAATHFGMELVEQKTYKWFGRSVGDYPIPEGFTASDLGKCDYALRIPGNSKAYEVGVVARKDGKPGYKLLWDFWQGGYGLREKIGEKGKKLKQEYGVALAIKHQRRKGLRCSRFEQENGDVVVKGVMRGAI